MTNASDAVPPAPVLAETALFLDVDGTLIEFARAPMRVDVPPPLRRLLVHLRIAADGACALISGRRIDVLDRLFERPMLPVAGLHGLERRDAAGLVHRHAAVDTVAIERIRQDLARFAAEHSGILIEDKEFAVALHYREAPGHETAARRFITALAKTLPPTLTVLNGHMVFEIKPSGADKGRAIRAFMDEAPFAGRIPAFVGDDWTDEAGFEFVNACGGLTVKVGAGKTTASFRLRDPVDVRQWLATLVDSNTEDLP